MKKIILFFTIVLFSFNSQAQMIAEQGAWYAYIGTYDLTKRFDVQLVTQARFHNILGDWDQYLLRVGGNYSLDPKGDYSIGLGVDYFYNDPYTEIPVAVKKDFNEFRIYQQLITKQDYKRFYFQHRYRWENRFRENQDVFFRFRYFLQVKMALNKKRIEPGTFYLAALNEVFWNMKGPNHFDRHWLHTTVGYKLNRNLTFEVGNQLQFVGNGRYNSRLQFWCFHNLDFIKKKRVEKPK